MKVDYAMNWKGEEAAHLTDEQIRLVETLLVERHRALCSERGIQPLDTTDCIITVWASHNLVSLYHPGEDDIISKLCLPKDLIAELRRIDTNLGCGAA